MSLSEQERSTLVQLYLNRAKSTYEDAEIAANSKKWSMAANRLYYAVFHAATALFVRDGRPVGTHRGAKAVLGQYYVKEGVISVDDSKLFAQLETLRGKADYNIMFEAQEKDILPNLPKAKDFIQTIEMLVI